MIPYKMNPMGLVTEEQPVTSSGYIVTGAGTPAANGTYTDTGTTYTIDNQAGASDGRDYPSTTPIYSNGTYILRYGDAQRRRWAIEVSGGMPMYLQSNDSINPDESTYGVRVMGTPPSPTVTAI